MNNSHRIHAHTTPRLQSHKTRLQHVRAARGAPTLMLTLKLTEPGWRSAQSPRRSACWIATASENVAITDVQA